jgi:hypothetical protein
MKTDNERGADNKFRVKIAKQGMFYKHKKGLRSSFMVIALATDFGLKK